MNSMHLFQFLGIASLIVTNAQAAVSSTGFTVSLTDIDYFLPPKPVAKISRCDELQSMFEDDLFVPFTVVNAKGYGIDVASLTAGYNKDDVWQAGFMEGMSGRIQTTGRY